MIKINVDLFCPSFEFTNSYGILDFNTGSNASYKYGNSRYTIAQNKEEKA